MAFLGSRCRAILNFIFYVKKALRKVCYVQATNYCYDFAKVHVSAFKGRKLIAIIDTEFSFLKVVAL